MNEKCTYTLKDGFHTCSSYQFNLWRDGIEQGDLCDVHYWQTKAQREWVGLTFDDQTECLKAGMYDGWMGVMNAAEAKLKEKNT